jgi:hypothetical protein
LTDGSPPTPQFSLEQIQGIGCRSRWSSNTSHQINAGSGAIGAIKVNGGVSTNRSRIVLYPSPLAIPAVCAKKHVEAVRLSISSFSSVRRRVECRLFNAAC